MMNVDLEGRIDSGAKMCVDSMGDVFWDFVPARDIPLGFRDPESIALREVRKELWALAADLERCALCPEVLRAEYRELVNAIDQDDEEAVATALIAKADWTLTGAVTVLQLAREYGTSVLRNALALAEALGIEDGSRGF